MENRDEIVADYFKLRVLLNRTNLVRDQKTELVFEALKVGAMDFRFIATLKGINNPKHIELCRKNQKGLWVTSNYSGLFSLENYCVLYLLRQAPFATDFAVLSETITKLHSELKTLGISL